MGRDSLAVGERVKLEVDPEFRARVTRNHTATHLLNESLRRVLGPHVRQQGSFVGDEYLRFDFNHYQNLTEEEILSVEDMVNGQIREGFPVAIYELPFKEAQKMNVQAVFGEKYDEIVRVVDTVFSKNCAAAAMSRTPPISADSQSIISKARDRGSSGLRPRPATPSRPPSIAQRRI